MYLELTVLLTLPLWSQIFPPPLNPPMTGYWKVRGEDCGNVLFCLTYFMILLVKPSYIKSLRPNFICIKYNVERIEAAQIFCNLEVLKIFLLCISVMII